VRDDAHITHAHRPLTRTRHHRPPAHRSTARRAI